MHTQDASIDFAWEALAPTSFAQRENIADRWVEALATVDMGEQDRAGMREFLLGLTVRLSCLLAEPATEPEWSAHATEEARNVGRALADRFPQVEAWAVTQRLLQELLHDDEAATSPAAADERLAIITSEMAVGFMTAREQSIREVHHGFLSHLRHELGTPLTAITGFVYILLEGMDGEISDAQREDILAIREATQHLIDLLNDMSDLYKIDMARLRPYTSSFPLSALLDELSTSVHDIVLKAGNNFKVQVDGDLGQMVGDRKKILRLLRSVVGHANWSTRSGSLELEVNRVSGEGEWVQFVLRDTGIGYPGAQLSLLSQRSFDLEYLCAIEMGGPGLALLLCRYLAELLGGTFRVSSASNKGSVYEVRLPLALTS